MAFHQGLHGLVILLQSSGTEVHNYLETSTDSPILVVFLSVRVNPLEYKGLTEDYRQIQIYYCWTYVIGSH